MTLDARELYRARCHRVRHARAPARLPLDRADPPCEGWDVRQVVSHLVEEDLWAPLLSGKAIAECGDRFGGDLLGDAPVAAVTRSPRPPSGDVPGQEYVRQLAV